MHNRLLIMTIFISSRASKVFPYSVVTSSNLNTRPSSPNPTLGAPSPEVDSMETKMLKEFHNLCMSGAVPEAGLITKGSHHQWIYCSQAGSGKHPSKSKFADTPQAVSFVEPAPVEQMHRVIVNTKRAAAGSASAPTAPVIYVLPPKISNNYTVEVDYDDSSNHTDSHHHAPPHPIVHFLSRDAQYSEESLISSSPSPLHRQFV